MNNIKNSYENYSKVLLEAIQDSQIDDENLEPQIIKKGLVIILLYI